LEKKSISSFLLNRFSRFITTGYTRKNVTLKVEGTWFYCLRFHPQRKQRQDGNRIRLDHADCIACLQNYCFSIFQKQGSNRKTTSPFKAPAKLIQSKAPACSKSQESFGKRCPIDVP
jgi:hypothetical protein